MFKQHFGCTKKNWCSQFLKGILRGTREPTPSAHVCASTLAHTHRALLPFSSPFPFIPLRPHRLRTSAHPCSVMPTRFSSPSISLHCLASTSSARRPCMHARSCPPGPSTHPFRSIPLRPHRAHTSAQIRSLSTRLTD